MEEDPLIIWRDGLALLRFRFPSLTIRLYGVDVSEWTVEQVREGLKLIEDEARLAIFEGQTVVVVRPLTPPR